MNRTVVAALLLSLCSCAWAERYPLTLRQGEPPSIVQVKTEMELFNRPTQHRMAAALFEDARLLAESLAVAKTHVERMEALLGVVRARVAEGRESPAEQRRADLVAVRARNRAAAADLAIAGDDWR